MKTTLELPAPLMRAVKVRAAKTDRKLKDVVAELIAKGLEAAPEPRGAKDPLEAVLAAGDELARSGVDAAEWAARSRDVWR